MIDKDKLLKWIEKQKKKLIDYSPLPPYYRKGYDDCLEDLKRAIQNGELAPTMCKTCAYTDRRELEEPCKDCNDSFQNWKPKGEKE